MKGTVRNGRPRYGGMAVGVNVGATRRTKLGVAANGRIATVTTTAAVALRSRDIRKATLLTAARTPNASVTALARREATHRKGGHRQRSQRLTSTAERKRELAAGKRTGGDDDDGAGDGDGESDGRRGDGGEKGGSATGDGADGDEGGDDDDQQGDGSNGDGSDGGDGERA